MTAVSVTFRRTVGRACRRLSTAFSIAGFLAVTALLFAVRAEGSEGAHLPLSAVWASCVAPVLPALAALLAMDVWSAERQSGRIDVLLSIAVRERDYVFGKFLGVAVLLFVSVLVSLASTLIALVCLSAEAPAGAGVLSFASALFALMLQGFCWCAAALAFSAAFRSASASLVASLLSLVVVPRLLWHGLRYWVGDALALPGEMPLDAHVTDLATGLLPVGTVVAYAVATALLLFVAAKFVAFMRLVGRGARLLRFSTAFAIVLSLVTIALAAVLCLRVNPTFEVSSGGVGASLSARSRGALQNASGYMTVTVFLSRRDVRYREVLRVLRLFSRESEFLGGVRIELRHVDPHWDLGAAERLVRLGATENSLVFEKGSRNVFLPIDRNFGERVCAAVIGRLNQPLQRRNVYWTVGHGESAFDSYRAFGMSDIARDLAREGFLNAPLDLAATGRIPNDCALVLVAGAKDDFSRAEIGRLDEYLRSGGRLLVLLGSAKADGVNSLLSTWGLRPSDLPRQTVKTMTGTDVVVSTFADHPVSAPLVKSRIIMERPVAFTPSAAAGAGVGVERIAYAPIAFAGSGTVVASAERGAGAGQDLALRPTRIVAIGDASFAMNGQLAARACANRDFFLNCVSFLSGSDTYGSGEEGASVFRLGLDRRAKTLFVGATAVAVPLVVLLALAAASFRRNSRP